MNKILMSLLDILNVNVYISNIHILRDISFILEEGESVAIIGPNGAGKTTTLKTIVGLLPLKSGKIIFNGEDISNLQIEKRVEKGIGYSPEDRRLIPDLTVEENILLPCWISKLSRTSIDNNLKKVYEFFPELKELKNRKAKYLSGGQQKIVSIARALIKMPKLLLLDEPFEGLSPLIAKRLLKIFEQIKSMNISMIIADSSPTYPKAIADKIIRIERGEIKEVLRHA
ncbi:MAG: ABC transporter ATP-binding protein [Nitrososphaerota archaeon]